MKSLISTILFVMITVGLLGSQQDEFLTAIKGVTSMMIRTGPMNPGRFDTVRYLYETDDPKEIEEFISIIQLEEPTNVIVDGDEVIQLTSFCEASYVFEFRKEKKEENCVFGLTNCDRDFRSLCLSATGVPLFKPSKASILSFLDKLEKEWELHQQEIQTLLKLNE